MEEDKFLQTLFTQLNLIQQKDKRLYGWEIHRRYNKSCQRLLYGIKDNTLHAQTIRDNIIEWTYNITVFTRCGEPVVMGNFTATIDSFEDVTGQIEEAVNNSLSVSNSPWNLVEPCEAEEHQDLVLVDDKIKDDPGKVCDDLVNKINSITGKLSTVHVNYAELFIDYSRQYKITSTGIKWENEISNIYFEIAMEKIPLPNRQEIHNSLSLMNIKSLKLQEFIQQAVMETELLEEVKVPDTDQNAVILVREDVINSLFHCLLEQLNAYREYIHTPFLKEGDTVHSGVLETGADPVNLKLDPFINYMAESCLTLPDGLGAKCGTVIENNIVKQRFVSNRISQYLGYAINPVTGNIILETGKNSYEDLLKKAPKVIEIISFSSLLLNADRLTYSSEIKLAKEINNQTGVTRFLKGGVVSGSIRENLTSVLFSNSKTTHNAIGDEMMGYIGPRYMLLRSGVTISGQ